MWSYQASAIDEFEHHLPHQYSQNILSQQCGIHPFYGDRFPDYCEDICCCETPYESCPSDFCQSLTKSNLPSTPPVGLESPSYGLGADCSPEHTYNPFGFRGLSQKVFTQGPFLNAVHGITSGPSSLSFLSEPCELRQNIPQPPSLPACCPTVAEVEELVVLAAPSALSDFALEIVNDECDQEALSDDVVYIAHILCQVKEGLISYEHAILSCASFCTAVRLQALESITFGECALPVESDNFELSFVGFPEQPHLFVFFLVALCSPVTPPNHIEDYLTITHVQTGTSRFLNLFVFMLLCCSDPDYGPPNMNNHAI